MGIFTHACLGTNDIERARIFYDAALAPLGVICLGNFLDQGLSYGRTVPELLILKPLDSRPALAGNGVTLSFKAFDHAAVDAFHQEGLSHGGTDAGTPGPRGAVPAAYGAYLIDPDARKRVGAGKQVGVRVGHGGRRTIQKKRH